MSGGSHCIVAAANGDFPDGYIIDYDVQPGLGRWLTDQNVHGDHDHGHEHHNEG
jgi:hypothetical protein